MHQQYYIYNSETEDHIELIFILDVEGGIKGTVLYSL